MRATARAAHPSRRRLRRLLRLRRLGGCARGRWPLTASNNPASLVPAARFRARVLLFLFSSHPRRGERGAERRSIPVVARFGARRAVPSEARRASSGTRSPLGAPPWRFWAGGRASLSGLSSGSVQRAPRSQVIVPGGRGPEPPGADGYEPRPQDDTPRSAFGSSPETAPPMSEDARSLRYARLVVKSHNAFDHEVVM